MARPRNFKVMVAGKRHSAVECKKWPKSSRYNDRCPKCDSENAIMTVEVQQYGFDRVATVTVMKCSGCGVEWFKEEIWIDGVAYHARTPITE